MGGREGERAGAVTRDQIIAAALAYLGAPFRFAGRSRRGLDCVGLPLVVARDLRLEGWQRLWGDRSCHAYPTVRPPGFLRAKLDGFVDQGVLRRIDLDALEPADLVLRWGGYGHDHHVSLLLEGDWILEASNRPEPRYPKGRVVKRRTTPGERRASFLTGYQFMEVE